MTVVNTLPAASTASDKSLDYLVALVNERTGESFDASSFEGMSQQKVSDAIRVENEGPATEAQIARVAELVKQLNIPGTVTSNSRAQAARQIKDMGASMERIRAFRIRKSRNAELSDDRRSAAQDFLAALSVPASIKADTANDDLPF
ncbi:MAG: hypothetical protein H0U53_11055 [Actinobacteria bacterium]|nr:hypothetical protein [Actinomycetota bacterium]